MKWTRRRLLHRGACLLAGAVLFRRGFEGARPARAAVRAAAPPRNPAARLRPRVAAVHAPGAVTWDGRSYPYVDGIVQARVDAMLDRAVQLLTGEASAAAAWRSLFASYRPGERVAVKPNFNDLYKDFHRNLVVSPAVLNAVIAGLVRHVGIRPEHVIVYDCTRIIPDALRDRIREPVGFVEPFGSSFWRKVRYHTLGNPLPLADPEARIDMGQEITDKAGRPVTCHLPRLLARCRHLVNVPLLKAHQFVSHSGALKNHYGTVRFSDGHTGPEYLHPPRIHRAIAAVNAAAGIRDKTRLVVMDALFGRLHKRGGPPDAWTTLGPRPHPERIAVSTDPVALDSVALAWLAREAEARGETLLSHEYLHRAEARGLGVHDHPGADGRFGRIELLEAEA